MNNEQIISFIYDVRKYKQQGTPSFLIRLQGLSCMQKGGVKCRRELKTCTGTIMNDKLLDKMTTLFNTKK